jgi:hypothetical protein
MFDRKQLRFRLATLFAVLTLSALGFAWWGKWRRALQEEQAALAAIRERAEGHVVFEDDWNDATQRPRSFVLAPQRTLTERLLARNALDRVAAVSFNAEFDRDGVQSANPFTTSWRFQLARIPDESLTALSRFPRLRWLDFSGANLTDEQLVCLPQLPALETVRLRGARNLSAKGLEVLNRFPRLNSLDLSNAKLRDADLAGIASLENLEQLQLESVPITNKGLPLLYGLKRLRRLNLKDTQVTRIGVYRLRQQLPEMEILTPYDEDQ